MELIQQWHDGANHFTLKTSGSTGSPKTILFTREQVIASAQATKSALGLPEKGIGLVCLPTEFTGGFMALMRCLVYGYEVRFTDPKQPVIPKNQRITLASMTPHQLYKLREEGAWYQLNNIDFLLLGGGELPASMVKDLITLHSGVYHTFGMTETLSHFALRQISPVYASEYQLLPGASIKTDDDNRLWVNVSYLHTGWLETHDMVKWDQKSDSFTWLGRKDNVVNSGGIKIYPEQVEHKLRTVIPQPFYLVGEADEKFGSKLVLKIEAKTIPTDELLTEIKKNVSSYEVPKSIICVPTFERTETGKIKRI